MAINTSNGANTTLVEADAQDAMATGIDKVKAGKRINARMRVMTAIWRLKLNRQLSGISG